MGGHVEAIQRILLSPKRHLVPCFGQRWRRCRLNLPGVRGITVQAITCRRQLSEEHRGVGSHFRRRWLCLPRPDPHSGSCSSVCLWTPSRSARYPSRGTRARCRGRRRGGPAAHGHDACDEDAEGRPGSVHADTVPGGWNQRGSVAKSSRARDVIITSSRQPSEGQFRLSPWSSWWPKKADTTSASMTPTVGSTGTIAGRLSIVWRRTMPPPPRCGSNLSRPPG